VFPTALRIFFLSKITASMEPRNLRPGFIYSQGVCALAFVGSFFNNHFFPGEKQFIFFVPD